MIIDDFTYSDGVVDAVLFGAQCDGGVERSGRRSGERRGQRARGRGRQRERVAIAHPSTVDLPTCVRESCSVLLKNVTLNTR